MTAKRLQMRQIREVLRLKWASGLTHREIARSCGTGSSTVSYYVHRAAAAGLTWPLPDDLDEAALEARLFPALPTGMGSRPPPDPVRLHEELQRPGVTLQLLWEEYRTGHADGLGYSQFCEHYRRWRKRLKPTMRQVHRVGERTFTDFSGKRPWIVNRVTGEAKPVELFVAVLGASSYTYAEACASQDLASWVGAHQRMCEYIGGSTEIWVPDNLKSAITKPCRYEPTVTTAYAELAEHHGAVIIPARVRKPKDKAKAESGVLVVQRWILARLRNRTFFSLTELNVAIRELLVDLNDRPMRATKKSRREQFESLDRPYLKPLPAAPFESRSWKKCTVNIDYHVEIEGNYYSVPHALIHQQVEVRWTHATVEVFSRGKRVTSHAWLSGRGRHSTKPEHMPSSHRAHAEWTPSRMLRWASASGESVRELIARVLEEKPHPEMGYRSCLGIIRLGERHGKERLEAACRRALALKSCSYQTVKNILSSGVEQLPLPVEHEPRPRVLPHDNVRGGAYYDQETRS